MICAACGSANDAGLKFCTECGAPLSTACPSCSAANKPGNKFCGECGTPLAAPGAASTERPPTAEPAATSAAQRRVVTVLFADLVGFTTISQHRDAEDVRELLGQYFEAARAAVERHGGVVEKFIGDAVMAVWGTDTAHEDDAERAVRAALEVVESVAALGSRLDIDLAARAGVLTGEAAVTMGAEGQGLVAGDMVNTASRLQSAADPGTVLVGPETYQASSDAISFEARGSVSVKGKDEPVEIWRAIRVVAERGGGGRPGRPEPPFVGRAEELRLIKDLLHVTGREQRPRLISVTGIGGIGKSRLAWEFQKYVDGLSEDVFWHQGRCPSYGEGVTFWALGEMVRMRAGIAETDDPDEARCKLSTMLEAQLRDTDERHWVEPRLRHLLGLDDALPGDREELFSAWRTLFERIAERGVTVLVFEDLHWADSGLLDFIESILEWSRNSSILVLTLARPELLDRRPTWGARQRNFTAQHLDPLAAEPMTELVTGFVTGLPEDDAQRVVARAEGVPLYAVETIRMLADRGVLTVSGNCYAVAADIGELDVPSSLHALIAARLDVLPAGDRDLLRDAAVLGTAFTIEALATIREERVDAVEPRLRDLVRKEFLVQDTDPRSPERGQYTFLQGLIREVAYGTLSKVDRRRKHLAVAKHLEALGDDEVAGVVASHYVDALRSTPEGPEADELAATVRRTVSAAAWRALSLGSPDQALTYVQQALELTPEQDRAPLLELAGDAQLNAGQVESGISSLQEAVALYRTAGDYVGTARATALLSRPMTVADSWGEARAMLEQAVAEFSPGADDQVEAELRSRLAEVHRHIGNTRQALEAAEEALIVAERVGTDAALVDALSARASALFDVGRHREAVLLARGAVDIARKGGARQPRVHALMTLSVMLVEESPQETLETMLACAEAAREAGARMPELFSLTNALESAIDLGAFREAEAILADLSGRGVEDLFHSGVQFSAATLAAYRGDHAAAAAHLESVEARKQVQHRMLQEVTWHLRAASLVQLLAGDLDTAYATGMESVAMEPAGMNAAGSLTGCGHAAIWLRDPHRLRETVTAMEALHGQWISTVRVGVAAALDAVEGRTEAAAAAFRSAFEEWTRRDLPFDRAWSVVDALAVLPRELVDDEYVAQARATLTEINSPPLLARLDAAEAGTAVS
jgi:class 3 adenylate cyclase/tetratricopeptide (TPR) repeat protein